MLLYQALLSQVFIGRTFSNSIVCSWCLVDWCGDVGWFLDVSGFLGVCGTSVVHGVAEVVQIHLAEIAMSVWGAVEERRRSAIACSGSAWLNVGIAVRADDEAEVVVVIESIATALSWVMTIVGVLSSSERFRDGAHHSSQSCQNDYSSESIHIDLIAE